MLNADKSKCSGCEACYNVCKFGAITMEYDKEGFCYPVIDNKKCVGCNMCYHVCPYHTGKYRQEQEFEKQKAYACYNTNDKERIISSSGGIFPLIARRILERGGTVYAAAYTHNFLVEHKRISKIEELEQVQGSKYLQSRIGLTYQNIKQDLLENKKVLFCGTSCQVAGLKGYLGKEHPNLYIIDLICKSIPSPIIWEKYLTHKFRGKKIKSINFKEKSEGWHRFTFKVETENGDYKVRGMKSLYLQGFFKGIYCRPSCFECPFKGTKRFSDVTLADCWGIDKMAPELFDEKGVSSVVLNSEKGLELFSLIGDELQYLETDIDDIKKYNPYIEKSADKSKVRGLFYGLYGKLPFMFLIRIFCYPYLDKARYLYRAIFKRRKK